MLKDVGSHEEKNMKKHLSVTKTEMYKTKDQLTTVMEQVGIVVYQLQFYEQRMQYQPPYVLYKQFASTKISPLAT